MPICPHWWVRVIFLAQSMDSDASSSSNIVIDTPECFTKHDLDQPGLHVKFNHHVQTEEGSWEGLAYMGAVGVIPNTLDFVLRPWESLSSGLMGSDTHFWKITAQNHHVS